MAATVDVLGAVLKTASATASPGMPAGALRVGDILFMWANVSSGTISISANSTGWVLLDHSTQSLTNAVEGYLWAMRVTDVAMAGPELTRTAGDYMIGRIGRIRGAWEGGAVTDAIVGSRYTNSGAGVFTLSHTTYNTTADDALIIYIGQRGLDATGSDMPHSGITRSGSNLAWCAPYQDELADGTTTGNGGGYAFCFGYMLTAGAVGQLDWTHGTASGWIKQSFAVRGLGRDTVAPARIESAEIVYGPALNANLYTMTPPRIESSEVVYAPALSQDFTTMRPARIESAEVVYAPALSVDLHTLRPPRIESSEVVYGGDLSIDPDTVNPEIGNFTPANGATIRDQSSLGFDVTDDNGFAVVALFASWIDPETALEVFEGIHDGTNFRGNYTNSLVNTRTAISGGYRYSIRRAGGWPKDADGNNVSLSIEFLPVDASGNIGEIA